jgi:hypothetical protein
MIRLALAPEIQTRKQAERFVKDFVLVRRSDLARIGKWAKKRKLYGELKKLDVEYRGLHLSGIEE